MSLAAAGMLGAGAAASSAAPTSLDVLTWSDEFDGRTLDSTRWAHRASGPRHDGILTPDAVSVDGGRLMIKTYTKRGRHYSGMISTRKRGAEGFEQAYGYFEARIKFNSTPGQWSAFWLQSPTVGRPVGDPANAGVEMDIVEHRARCVRAQPAAAPAACTFSNDVSDRSHQALIWDGYGRESQSTAKLSDPLAGLGNAGWHTWALRWTPTQLTFSYDNAVIWTVTRPISRRAQFMIFSSEVGAFFAGAIPAAGYGSRATSTTNMQVDYVRAYINTSAQADPGAPESPGTAALGGRLLAPLGLLAPRASTPPTSSRPAPLTAAPAQTAVVARSAPKATLAGSRRQRLGRAVTVRIGCAHESCRATARGTVRALHPATAPTYKPRPVRATIAKGIDVTVKLKLSARARAVFRRALRTRKRIVVDVHVRVVNDTAKARTLTRQIALRL